MNSFMAGASVVHLAGWGSIYTLDRFRGNTHEQIIRSAQQPMMSDEQEREEIEASLRGDNMQIRTARDPIAWLGIGLTVLFNIAGLAWVGGKFEQRVINAESKIEKLEAETEKLQAKAEKDAAQDVQIAVISEQLSQISSGVGEIKARLEGRK